MHRITQLQGFDGHIGVIEPDALSGGVLLRHGVSATAGQRNRAGSCGADG